MKTAELTGALLDYWTARAEGIPADQLEIREVPRTDITICVRKFPDSVVAGVTIAGRSAVCDYSTSWASCGPLIEKHRIDVYEQGGNWYADKRGAVLLGCGDTPQQAICRAVVRAAFGDEVEDLPC